MKKRILVSLILVSSGLTMNAQIYTPSSAIQGSSGNNNVGIGTSTPDYLLTVGSSLNRGIVKIEGNAPFLSLSNTQLNGNSWRFYSGGNSAGNFNIYDTNSDQFRLTIGANGNTGIGTTTPGSKLDIQGGSLTVAGLNVYPATINLGVSSAGHEALEATSTTLLSVNKNGAWPTLSLGGNVLIGTSTPDTRFKLNVEGTIRTSEVNVCLQGGCDFVFYSDYKLMDLKALETFVRTNHHLPEIAPEKEMVEDGVNMKEFQMKLLQKIEELTLYTIEQNKKLEQQNEKIEALQLTIKAQNEKFAKIESASK